MQFFYINKNNQPEAGLYGRKNEEKVKYLNKGLKI